MQYWKANMHELGMTLSQCVWDTAVKRATYIKNKDTVIRVTSQLKRPCKTLTNLSRSFVVTVGRPNYREREIIRKLVRKGTADHAFDPMRIFPIEIKEAFKKQKRKR